MSFASILDQYRDFSFDEAFGSIDKDHIIRAISSEKKDPRDLLSLLSPKAQDHLETMAEEARKLTLQYFGKAIILYTPLYLSNYCDNRCLYCGFSAANNLVRKKLSLEEVRKEAEAIASSGIHQLLILTGDSRSASPLPYILDCLKILKEYFSSVSAEIYTLSQEEYSLLAAAGIDGLTVYQETYHQKTYDLIHPDGPKKDYHNRLQAPEAAAKCRIRNINIGALLGLSDFRKEAFYLLMHALYLQNNYPESEISISLPRIRPQVKNFKPFCAVSDAEIVQLIVAARIFMPRLGITLSTRENQLLRDNLIPLGITRISAGSTTAVGGHSLGKPYDKQASQFEIADQRSVEEIKKAVSEKGYQPVLKDWMNLDDLGQ